MIKSQAAGRIYLFAACFFLWIEKVRGYMKDIYYNGTIHIKKCMDVEAMGVENGRVAVIGSQSEVELWARGAKAAFHDLEGSFVVPGFNDSHMHLLEYGCALSRVSLSSSTSLSEMLQRLRQYKEKQDIKKGDWIVGRGWNQDYFQDEKRFPNRKDLDQVSTEHPILIYRACGHIACANSMALRLAKITRDTAWPDGGSFDLDETGEPNGVFREYGIDLISSAVPKPGLKELKSFLLHGIKGLNAYGITSVQTDDFAVFPGLPWEMVLKAYKELEAEGLLTIKVREQCLLSGQADLKDFLKEGWKTGKGSRLFSIGPLKIIADGSLGARTALLSHPYADDEENPENRGVAIYNQKELEDFILYGAEHGMQVAVHAIGDGAMDMVIKALEKAMAGERENRLRHGIVHCQITTKELLEKFKELKLHSYIQSIFLDYDSGIVESRLGKERAAETYQFGTLLDMGLSVSNGSDAPVERPCVLDGIQCAVTRSSLDGSRTFLPDQALTVEEALETYTWMGARASFEEEEKGALLPGMAADFTVLSRDIRSCDPMEIGKTSVLATFVDGCKV